VSKPAPADGGTEELGTTVVADPGPAGEPVEESEVVLGSDMAGTVLGLASVPWFTRR
jgi:hypothetical protein